MSRELVGDVTAGKGEGRQSRNNKCAAERVDIALNTGCPAVPCLLGRHVIDRPDRRPFPRDSFILEFVLESQGPGR